MPGPDRVVPDRVRGPGIESGPTMSPSRHPSSKPFAPRGMCSTRESRDDLPLTAKPIRVKVLVTAC
jgi:hypothetical protein